MVILHNWNRPISLTTHTHIYVNNHFDVIAEYSLFWVRGRKINIIKAICFYIINYRDYII